MRTATHAVVSRIHPLLRRPALGAVLCLLAGVGLPALAWGADTDGDRLDDAMEQAAGTDPTEADSDGDGQDDGLEVARGTDPLDPESFTVAVPLLGPWNGAALAAVLAAAARRRLR